MIGERVRIGRRRIGVELDAEQEVRRDEDGAQHQARRGLHVIARGESRARQADDAIELGGGERPAEGAPAEALADLAQAGLGRGRVRLAHHDLRAQRVVRGDAERAFDLDPVHDEIAIRAGSAT